MSTRATLCVLLTLATLGACNSGGRSSRALVATPVPPTITAVSPNTGSQAGGTTVTITGANYQTTGAGAHFVAFGLSGAAATVVNDTTLTVVTPPATAAGVVSVTVTNALGSASLASAFTYTAAASVAPTISSVSPQTGPTTGGTTVTVRGLNYQASGAGSHFVSFGQTAVSATVVNDTELTAVTPSAAATGPVDVRVLNGNGAALMQGGFTYATPAPVGTFSPAVGRDEPGLGGTRITVTLTNYPGLTPTGISMVFSNVNASNVALVDSRTVTGEVPAGLVGPIDAVDISVREGTNNPMVMTGFRIQGILSYGDVTINEFLDNAAATDSNRDGTQDNVTDEFVEIVNTLAVPVDLSFLELRDSVQLRHRFPNATTLPPGGALVVFGGGTPIGFAGPHTSGQAQTATAANGLGLNNSADTISITNVGGLTAFFQVTYTSSTANVSLNNDNDGQRITVNPAAAASSGAGEYATHNTLPGAVGAISPGRRVNQTPF